LESTLNGLVDSEVWDIQDESGFTLLHLAAFKNKFKSFCVIVKVANQSIKKYTYKEGIIK
jgi:hypothetical protein